MPTHPFTNIDDAIGVLWEGEARLAALINWLVIALLHLGLIQMLLLVTWLFDVSAADALAFAKSLLDKPLTSFLKSAISALGLSLSAIAALYLLAMQRIHAGVLRSLVLDFLHPSMKG